MTIVTKPLSDKNQDSLKKPLVVAGAVINEESQPDLAHVEDPGYAVSRRGQRASAATILCLFLASLAVLGVGIVGGLYIYRYYGRVGAHKLKGWIPVHAPRELMFQGKTMLTLREEFEIDVEANYENVSVPDFGLGPNGRFIHDFVANKTGIVDPVGHQCFVLPLNRDLLLPPRSIFELLTKAVAGDYDLDPKVLRETYRVIVPPLTKVEDMGEFIYRNCEGIPTYRLIKIDDRLFKRSLAASKVFTEIAGKKMVQVNIIMDGLEEYKEAHGLSSK